MDMTAQQIPAALWNCGRMCMGLVLPRSESAAYASRSSPNPTLWPPWLMLLPSIKADSVSFTPGGQNNTCIWGDRGHILHHHLSLNHKGRWGTKDDLTTSFLHFSLFSTALWDLPNSRPVHLQWCTSSILDTSVLVYSGRHGPCWPRQQLIQYGMVACCHRMVSHGQSTTWCSPSLSRSKTGPLRALWNLVTVKISAQ